MMLISGVFFPTEHLPLMVQQLAAVLPLTHAVAIVRPLMNGVAPVGAVFHLSALIAYTALGFYLALALMRRRLLI
jgi:lipooligosaccharide transport system permease protein